MPPCRIPEAEAQCHLGSWHASQFADSLANAKPFHPIEPIGFHRQDWKPLTKICIKCYHWLILVTGSHRSELKEATGDEDVGSLRCACHENCGNEYLISTYTTTNSLLDPGVYALFSYRRTLKDFVSDQADCFSCARLFDSHYAARLRARNTQTDETSYGATLAEYENITLSFLASWEGSRDKLTLKGLSLGDPDGDPIPVELKLVSHDDGNGFFGSDALQIRNVDETSDMLWPFDPPSGSLGVPYPTMPLVQLYVSGFKQKEDKKITQSRMQDMDGNSPESSFTACSIDESRLSLIKAWRKNCMSDPEHKSCRNRLLRPPKSSAFPRRLVHVGSPRMKPCLVETADLPQENEVSYATLSHCWGSAVFATLTTENYASWLDEIKLDSLPKTFRDAIWLCSQLEIYYIWIDSLCIIQRSAGDEDWKREAPRMAEIYGNSSLTLAADGFDAANVGLVTSFNPIYFAQISFVVSRGAHYLEDSYRTVQQLISHLHNGPLYQRAWVVQERYLSPFQVSFTKSQMVWCCKSAIAFECMPAENYVGAVEVEFNRALATTEGIDEQWRSIIAQYSHTKCTVPHDRAVALYGLVQDFERHYNRLGMSARYCAGLWEHTLAESLAWKALSFGHKRIENLVAPTWSWLNFQGKVEIKSTRKFEALEVLDVKLNPHDPSMPYGPTHGFVRLRTRVFLVTPDDSSSRSKLILAMHNHSQKYLRGLGLFDVDRNINFGLFDDYAHLDITFDELHERHPGSDYFLVTTALLPYFDEYIQTIGVVCETTPESDYEFNVPVLRRVGAWELKFTGEIPSKVKDAEQHGRQKTMFREVVII